MVLGAEDVNAKSLKITCIAVANEYIKFGSRLSMETNLSLKILDGDL